MKKSFLVLGSNDHWYADCATMESALEVARSVRGAGSIDDVEQPATVLVYECREVYRDTRYPDGGARRTAHVRPPR